MKKNELMEKIKKVTHHLSTLRDPENKYAVRVPDGRLIPNRDFTFWEWTSGVGLYGIWKCYETTKDKAFLDILTEWFDSQLKNEVEKNINTMVQMLTLSELYLVTKKENYLETIKEWAEWLVNDLPRTEEGGFQHVVFASLHEQQIWADTLMMSALTIARIGVLLNNDSYKQEAIKQFKLHIKYLFNEEKGLWYHGYSFINKDNFSGAFWGRGNAWPLISIPTLIQTLEIKEDSDDYKEFTSVLKKHIESIIKYQDKESGLWRTIIDDEDAYLETSCSAGFAYGIEYAITHNIIDKKYETYVEKAVNGLMKNITDDGALLNVSGGTPVFATKEEYKKVIVGDYPYGQSMVILALIEYWKNL